MARGFSYISVFSGIEAASCAWAPLGHRALAFSEVDPFCCAVLARRFPDVPNLGDICRADWRGWHGRVDVVVGGSPCQSFSLAGKRDGLAGASGLMWEYVRCVSEVGPRALVWENVPGALSSGGGEDFRCLLSSLDALGYDLAWRVLDAQYFNLAQRRERLFVVGMHRDLAGDPCAVLFEPESLGWDIPSSAEKRKALAEAARRRDSVAAGAEGVMRPADFVCMADTQPHTSISSEVCGALTRRMYKDPPVFVTRRGAMAQDGCDRFESLDCEAGSGRIIEIAGNTISRSAASGGCGLGICDPDDEGAYTLTCADRHAVAYRRAVDGDPYTIRRLMPIECERLQGFPDGWTDLYGWAYPDSAIDSVLRGVESTCADSRRASREEAVRRLSRWCGAPCGYTSDAERYRALGNSMAVSVMEWIGRRLALELDRSAS